MPFSKKQSDIDSVKKILKQRGMSDRENAISSRHSNGRTTLIKTLYPDELKNLLNTLNEFTDEVLLYYIYVAASDLHIIIPPLQTIDNEKVIIAYLKAKNLIDLITNKIEVVNPKGTIKITSPFCELKYVEKELLLSLLGNCLSEYYSKNN